MTPPPPEGGNRPDKRGEISRGAGGIVIVFFFLSLFQSPVPQYYNSAHVEQYGHTLRVCPQRGMEEYQLAWLWGC